MTSEIQGEEKRKMKLYSAQVLWSDIGIDIGYICKRWMNGAEWSKLIVNQVAPKRLFTVKMKLNQSAINNVVNSSFLWG